MQTQCRGRRGVSEGGWRIWLLIVILVAVELLVRLVAEQCAQQDVARRLRLDVADLPQVGQAQLRGPPGARAQDTASPG